MKAWYIVIVVGIVLTMFGCQSEKEKVDYLATDVHLVDYGSVNDDIKSWIDSIDYIDGSYVYHANKETYVVVIDGKINSNNYLMAIDSEYLSEKKLYLTFSHISKMNSTDNKSPLMLIFKANGEIDDVVIKKI